jgi:hypothetical protein
MNVFDLNLFSENFCVDPRAFLLKSKIKNYAKTIKSAWNQDLVGGFFCKHISRDEILAQFIEHGCPLTPTVVCIRPNLHVPS